MESLLEKIYNDKTFINIIKDLYFNLLEDYQLNIYLILLLCHLMLFLLMKTM